MDTMSDIDKILQVTKRAKENAARANSKLDLSSAVAVIVHLWLDMDWIQDLFGPVEQKVLALNWYNTVFKMRL